MPFPLTPGQRRRAVAMVVALTTNTSLAPQRYERQLLTQFERGELTLEQMESLLASGVHQVLYHSRAAGHPTQAELDALLTWSRAYNAAHGITGLLLYSDGRYLQVLEGTEAAIEDLYAHIQRDTRHSQVETVSRGPGPRRFAEWSMDFGYVSPHQLEQALIAVQIPEPSAVLVTDARLQALLQAFT
ncbi:BLUF domain-containing protein [Hymenobacter sp. M29]|uniref:BLUF domain-containing protein n=1 Tax=Hymenobacter mellowenesis TaxID=3063995 RepID=A0ABT9A6S7_9BACT|nr:BLUF domain-containing protein [Hymenobacter sp. M29]MDO7845533.1 BLUF domain-containing protein [Hymenobacter sp. M29]